MKIEKLIKKMKPFFNNTEAISPIIATIMVLVVAVAAGAGLYFWFDTFQASAQEEIGVSSTDSMRSMVIGSADIAINLMDEKFSFEGMDAAGDTSTDNMRGNGRISWAANFSPPGSGPGKNGINDVAYKDERFIVEIPITVSSSAALENVKIHAGVPSVVSEGESKLWAYHWLHLNRDKDYQLLKGDGTPFVGFINDSKTEVFEDNNGYTYYFGRSGQGAGIDMINGSVSTATGTVADIPGGQVDESALWGPHISGTEGALMVMALYTNTASQDRYFAFAKNSTGSELGWITCDYEKGNDSMYFNGIDKINEMFHGNTYEVADKLTPNKAVTVNTYFMVSALVLDNGQNTHEDDGMAEIVLPFTITTDEGLIEKTSVTLTIKD